MDVIVRRPPPGEGGGEGGTAVRGLPSVRQSTETCEEYPIGAIVFINIEILPSFMIIDGTNTGYRDKR